MIDATTRKWIRNAADEQAAANGCRFDESRGLKVIEFARRYLKLYEGDFAGQAFEPMEWQVECTMRMFGWVKPSAKWKREVRRFRQAIIFVPKKNGKSPSLAWWGLYLLCADGEQGQKIYLAAKDGSQAREIAGKHAIEMVKSSPALLSKCKINQSLMQITYLPTKSIMKPISSGDTRAMKSKEGLNGSVLVDEIHVVDREFMGRVSRAGISRSEPMQIEVSTAGDDPQGYGKERYDYGKQVNESGGNESLFFHAYEAPHNVRDEDLEVDPEKFGRMANPAWGTTIDPAEFMSDYQTSKVSIAEFSRFKMYRLNIWQQSANPWLRSDDWAKCGRKFTPDSFAGLAAYAALDLSVNRDLSALAFLAPFGERLRLWVDFFMPKETAQELNHKVSFLQWAQDGWITLTPGNTVDYDFIYHRFLDRCQQMRVREFAFDPYRAQKTTLEMSDGRVFDGKEVIKGTGVPRVEFTQTMPNFAAPTEEFEKYIIEGRLEHPDNPVLNWQAGHVQVHCDTNRNKRPIKPKHGDIKTIDGLVAAVMAMGLFLKNGGVSVYETRGIQTLNRIESPSEPELATVQWGGDWGDDDD